MRNTLGVVHDPDGGGTTEDAPAAGTSTSVGRTLLVAGRVLLWAALLAGIVAMSAALWQLTDAIGQLLRGSDVEAITVLVLAVPFVPVAPVLFLGGLVLAKRSDRAAFRAGLAGAIMAVLAVPACVAISFLAASILGLG